jgi:hypothetical protein
MGLPTMVAGIVLGEILAERGSLPIDPNDSGGIAQSSSVVPA